MVSTAGGIVIAIVVILVAAAIGWVVFSQLRARRLGVSFFLLLLLLFFLTLSAALLFPQLEMQAMFRDGAWQSFDSIAKPPREPRQSHGNATTE